MQSLTDLDAEAILLNAMSRKDVKPWSKTIATFKIDYAAFNNAGIRRFCSRLIVQRKMG
jgi:hypothetical protein